MATSPHPNQNTPDGHTEIVKLLSLRRLFPLLFLQPAVLFFLPRKRWPRAITVLGCMAFIGGILVGTIRMPARLSEVKDWAEFFRHQTAELRLENDRLYWQYPKDLPHTTHFDEWQITFAEKGASFEPKQIVANRDKGIWISHDAVYQWWMPGGRQTPVHNTFFKDGRVLNQMDAGKVWPDGFRLRGNEIVREATGMFYKFMPLLILGNGLNVLVQTLFYTVIFAVIPFIMRSPLSAGGFGNLLSLYLYAGIPPLIFALAYTALNLPFLDFGLLYVGGFIVYLMLMIRQARTKSERA